MGRFYARHVGSERSQIGDGAPRRADRGRDVDFDQSLRGLDELAERGSSTSSSWRQRQSPTAKAAPTQGFLGGTNALGIYLATAPDEFRTLSEISIYESLRKNHEHSKA